MNFMTVPLMNGQAATINVAEITYVVQTNLGAQIHFSSGESIITKLRIDELTLQITQNPLAN